MLYCPPKLDKTNPGGEMLKKSARPFIFLFLILAMASLACGIDWGDETQTAPPPLQPTLPSEEPTEAVDVTEEATATEENPFLTIEFDDDPVDWSYFSSKNKSTADDSDVAPFAEGGFFIFDLGPWLNVYATYDPWTYSDVKIDVGVDNQGHNDNNVNLVCRYSDTGWYEISITNGGLFDFYAVDSSYHKLTNGGSNDIHQGKAFNEYTMSCKGDTISLSINGVKVKSHNDTQYSFPEGQVGIGLSSFSHSPVKVAFDWMTISEP
jgi:hypothetical protein